MSLYCRLHSLQEVMPQDKANICTEKQMKVRHVLDSAADVDVFRSEKQQEATVLVQYQWAC